VGKKKRLKALKPLRNRLEYGLFLAVRRVVTTVPRKWSFALARGVADLLYIVDRKHTRVAKRNIAAVYRLPEDHPRTKALARESIRNMARLIMEFILLPEDLEEGEGRVVSGVEGWEKVEKVLEKGKGFIFVTGHIGNWELLGAWVSATRIPLSSVANPFRNPYLEKLLAQRRARYRQNIIHKEGALLKIAKVLKKGGVVAFLMDQHAGKEEEKLDFLGIPAYTYTGPARLAARFQIPLVPGCCHRKGSDFRYKVYVADPIYPDPEKDVEEEVLRLTRRANEAIGDFIRHRPEQWLWMHRRWR
jgi:KDO2-lipid IV(A) lauroyltransferase